MVNYNAGMEQRMECPLVLYSALRHEKFYICYVVKFLLESKYTCYLCVIVIYNRKYVFGLNPIPGIQPLKPLEFAAIKSHKGVMLMRRLLGTPVRMGSGCQENQPCDYSVGTFLHCRRGRGTGR